MSNPVHVILGTGPVGMAVMDELVGKGHTVRMVNRSGKINEPLPNGVELVSGDVTDSSFAVTVSEGAAVIYHALNPAYSKWVERFPPLQAAAVAAAAAHHAKLVVIDNLYMYGDPDGQPLTETLPNKAHTKKGRVRAQMAKDLMAAHDAGHIQVVVGRASDFIGPRVWASAMGGDLVIKRALQGKAAQVIGKIDMPHSYTYMPDVGRALVALGEQADTFGQVWHLPTPSAVSTRRMLELIYMAADKPLKIQVAPQWLLRLLGLFNPDAGEVVEMAYEFKQPFVIDDSKFVQRFGWGATALDVAVAETVAWFQRLLA